MNEKTLQIIKTIDFASGKKPLSAEGTHAAHYTRLQRKQMLSKFNHSSRNGEKIRYLVIHDTGNTRSGADAIAHAKYFGSGNKNASAHYFVDDKNIIQVVADGHAAWHCGDGKGRFGITNQNSLSVEICVHQNGDYDLAFINAAVLAAQLMEKYKIPAKNVVRHFDASRKICPRSMSANNWEEWQEFKALIDLYR